MSGAEQTPPLQGLAPPNKTLPLAPKAVQKVCYSTAWAPVAEPASFQGAGSAAARSCVSIWSSASSMSGNVGRLAGSRAMHRFASSCRHAVWCE